MLRNMSEQKGRRHRNENKYLVYDRLRRNSPGPDTRSQYQDAEKEDEAIQTTTRRKRVLVL